jgi:hypothetical protein
LRPTVGRPVGRPRSIDLSRTTCARPPRDCPDGEQSGEDASRPFGRLHDGTQNAYDQILEHLRCTTRQSISTLVRASKRSGGHCRRRVGILIGDSYARRTSRRRDGTGIGSAYEPQFSGPSHGSAADTDVRFNRFESRPAGGIDCSVSVSDITENFQR